MILLYLLLFVTPFHNDPHLGMVLFDACVMIITPIKILGLLAAALALVAPVAQDAAPRLRSPLIALFLPFAIVPVVVTEAYGLRTPTGSISQLISAALLFVAIRPLVRTRERMFKVVRTLVLAFAFGSLWVYKEHFIEHARQPWGLEGDANYEALMLLLSLPLAFWVARYGERSRWRRIGLLCALLLTCAIVLTESRAGIIAGGGMGLFAAVRTRHKLIGATLLASAAVLIFNFGPTGLSQRFESIKFVGKPLNGDEDSSRIHVELLKAGLRMMQAHPIFGVGVGHFKTVAPSYNPEILKLSRRGWIAHDTFIQIGSEAGIPALLLFLAMLRIAFRNFQVAQRSPDARLAALGFSMEASFIGISIAALSITVEFLPFCILIVLSQSLREIAAAADAQRSFVEDIVAMSVPELQTGAA